MLRATILAFTATVMAVANGAVLDHDAIPVWTQPEPTDATQQLAVRFKPFLDVVNGCQPYPAVDPNGDTSGGLKPDGSSSANCDDHSKAQVYGRSGTYNGYYAIMYAWYMPKDEPSPFIGHRNDWENCVVWLDSNTTANIVAISASSHSGYKKSYPADSSYIVDGVNVKVRYESIWPLDHDLGFTTTQGVQQPLIQWEQMTDAARNALETTDFGKADVPFNSRFQDKLAKAFFQ